MRPWRKGERKAPAAHPRFRLPSRTEIHSTLAALLSRLNEVDERRIGLNGSGTGGLIALHFAANHPEIRSLVIRGPVCGTEVEAAAKVEVPTLLIHAEKDTALCDSIEAIDRNLHSTHQLMRIPQSSRLFNDPISRELMIDSSVKWLEDHLTVEVKGDVPEVETMPASEETPTEAD